MSLTLQILLTGLAAGSVYGLLAVGNTLVFRLTGIVHFALGDLVGLGVFVALLVTSGRGPVTQASPPGATRHSSTPTSSGAPRSGGWRRAWRSHSRSRRSFACSSSGRHTSSPIRSHFT